MNNRKGFTLVELLVVIAIIGLIASLSVIALGNARSKSRDSKRVSDIKQMQTALELFFSDQGRYPTAAEWSTGSLYATGTMGTTTYMDKIPSAPIADGALCNATTSAYYYSTNNLGDSYSIRTCLRENTGSYGKGIIIASPEGVAKCGTATVQDRDGNVYNTVQIGNQCWLKQNMKVGTMLTYIFPMRTTRQSNDSVTEKFCFNNLASNCQTDGAFYEWAEAMGIATSYTTSSYSFTGNVQGICPTGFHIPSDAEWLALEQYTLSVIASTATQYPCNYTYSGGIFNRCADSAGALPYGAKGVGKSLKAVGKGTYVGAGDDLVGFSAIMPGLPWINSWNAGYDYYWSSTQETPISARVRGLYDSYSGLQREPYSKIIPYSVRCLKD
jgi:uncharacterized protein (TIGR02145 family)/prepilin-type N-terminal cleavage/methylation domain-containing protein